MNKESLKSSPSQPHSARIRAVLVDDSPVALELLGHFLNTLSQIEVVGTARNGEQGLALAEHTLPDLVLADLEMPRLGGLQLAETLRKKFPPMRVIIISTHEGEGWETLSNSHGASAFVPKRCVATMLPGLVTRLFAGVSLPVIPQPAPEGTKKAA